MATATGSYATTAALKALIGTTDSNDDTLLGLICDRVNQFIESDTWQVIAPIASAVYTYDGSGLKHLFAPLPASAASKGIGGFRAVTLLEIAEHTGGDYEVVPSTDYYLRGRFGVAGPYRWLAFSDQPAGSHTTFPAGFATVRVTATAGWPAIPDDLTELALVVAQRAWNARQQGHQDVSGTDEQGRPIVARYLAGRDRETLRRYRLRPPV